METSGCG